MPAIQTELRLTIEGIPTPLLVKRKTLQVGSCEQISLDVKGVPPPTPTKPAASAAKPGAGKPAKAKLAAKKPPKLINSVVYTPTLQNVKFAVIYDGGRGSGLRVKVGKSKFEPLTQPLVFMDGAAASFGTKPTIVVENDSVADRTAILLVGSDLPKGVVKVQPTKTVRPAATSAAKSAAVATNSSKSASAAASTTTPMATAKPAAAAKSARKPASKSKKKRKKSKKVA